MNAARLHELAAQLEQTFDELRAFQTTQSDQDHRPTAHDLSTVFDALCVVRDLADMYVGNEHDTETLELPLSLSGDPDDEKSVDEVLGAIQEGTSDTDKFATLILIALLRDISDVARAGSDPVRWQFEDRVLSVTLTCGLASSASDGVWGWLYDIASDMALEPTDPWV
jgi:hypothetical protein